MIHKKKKKKHRVGLVYRLSSKALNIIITCNVQVDWTLHSASARSKSRDSGTRRVRVPRRQRIAEWVRAKDILHRIHLRTEL